MNKAIGYHSILDIHFCDKEKIEFVDAVKQILNDVVDLLQLGKVAESYKQFEPVGVTGFILLEESHISIHTWPEHGYAAIDIFSCRAFDEEAINAYLRKSLKTDHITLQIVERGKMMAPAVFQSDAAIVDNAIVR